ncbi:MAG: hypothetical protein K8I00_04760 [Candidatus Omnitrophica bacterium]|nr:hypothetical protein [Candidatus Omnitrophota bacterium]
MDDGVTDANCSTFFWQWHAAPSSQVDPENGTWTSVDVDNDGYQEQIMGKNGTSSVDTMDFQEGDMFMDSKDPNAPDPGFSNQDVQMWTFTKNPLGSGDNIGTYLRVDEGRLFAPDTGRYVRDAQRKDSVDIIQRTLQLTRNTQRFCDNAGNLVVAGSQLGNQAGWTADVPNPVEVCSATQAGCFSPVTITQTCMVYPFNPALDQYPLIYVRSRIVDKHGRKYITPTDADPVVNFLK